MGQSACCHSSDHDREKDSGKIPEKPTKPYVAPCSLSELIPHLPYPVDDAKVGWVRERQQLLKLHLDELTLFRQCPELESAWYQQTTYYVSFHPTSEPEKSLGFPHDCPPAAEDKLKHDNEKNAEKDSDHRHHKHRKHHHHDLVESVSATSKLAEKCETKNDSAAVVVHFDEDLELPANYLHDRLSAYIWGRRSINGGYRAEDVILAGYCVLPLGDFSFHGKTNVWPVFQSTSHEEEGEVKLQFAIATATSVVREPQVTNVKQTELTLRWKPPLNDFGSPVLSYQVEVLRLVGHTQDQGESKHEQKSKKDKQKHHKHHHKKHVKWAWEWVVSGYGILYPVHVVRELEIDTEYTVRVTAINCAGMNEPYELEVRTAAASGGKPLADLVQATSSQQLHTDAQTGTTKEEQGQPSPLAEEAPAAKADRTMSQSSWKTEFVKIAEHKMSQPSGKSESPKIADHKMSQPSGKSESPKVADHKTSQPSGKPESPKSTDQKMSQPSGNSKPIKIRKGKKKKDGGGCFS